MKVKNVTIGLTYYWPNVSGLSIYAKNLAEGLTENNIKVTVICGKNDNKEKELEIINKVTVKRISGIRIGKGIFLPFYFLKIINIVRKTDVVICQLPSIECLCLAFWAKIFTVLNNNPATKIDLKILFFIRFSYFLSTKSQYH